MLNIFAYAGNSNSICTDMQFWMSNTAGLKQGYPCYWLFAPFLEMKYHYFSNIPIAFLSKAYNIDIFTLSYPLYVITKTTIMFGSILFLQNLFKIKGWKRLLCYSLSLFTTGLEKISAVTILHHTLLSPFGFDISYAYAILFVSLLILQQKKKTIDVYLYLSIVLSWIMCIGSKGPVATIIIVYPLLICVESFIKKEIKKALFYSFTILIIFIVICYFNLGLFSTDSVSSRMSLYGIENIVESNSFGINNYINQKNIIISLLVKIIKKTVFINPTIIICSTIAIVNSIKNNSVITKNEKLHIVYLMLTSIFGLGLGVVVNAGGSSEMYFSIASLIPLNVICFFFIDKMENKSMIASNKKRIVYFLFLLLVVFGNYFFLFGAYETSALNESYIGFRNICDSFILNKKIYPCDKEDLKAYIWIRNNTNESSIVISDNAIIRDKSNYLCGVFTERKQYIEATRYIVVKEENLKAYEEAEKRKNEGINMFRNCDLFIQRLKEKGVNYIIQTKEITPYFIYNKNLLVLEYCSSTINIYKIK